MAQTPQEKKYSVTITPLPKSQIEVVGEIPWEHLATFEDAAFGKLASHVELPGFRKGNVPKDIARKHVPDDILLGDMAELAINGVYPNIISDHSLDVIGRPNVSITKIARGNPLGFTIHAAVVPTITLPDYKTIGASVALEDAKKVTTADVDKVVHDLQEMRAYGHVHGEHAESHAHDGPLPEADDAFAQTFGNFKTMQEMKDKIKENLVLEADQAATDKRRVTIMEDIIKTTSFDVPEIIIQSEKEKMIAQIEADVARNGGTIEDYLTHIKKTKEDLLQEFAPEAEKRARFQLVLNAIARQEKLLPTEAEVDMEAQKYMTMYPGADLNRTKAYADMMLTNEKVLSMLEGNKKDH